MTNPKNCRRCGDMFHPRRSVQIYCSAECRRPPQHNKCRGLADGVPPGTVGAVAELAVAALLMSEGYDVFRSLSPHSFCDLIAVKGGEVRKLEVRSGTYNYLGKLFYSPQVKAGATEFAVYIHHTKQTLFIPISR